MGPEILEIRLLGEFTLLKGGREVPSPPIKNARLLVARLALNPGHEFVRDDLSTHLWPDSDIEAARFNLRQLLVRMRRAAPDLSPCIVAGDRTTLRFDGPDARVDALEFRRLVASAPDKAIRHYRGPLLENLEDSWLEPPRAELEELYLGALESLADRSEPREAVAWLRLAVDCDPYREPLQQKLLSRLAECGDLTGMQVSFREFRSLLHRELNIAPSAKTEHLYRFLLADQAAPNTPFPTLPPLRSRLPVPATEVVGREAQIREVLKMLETERLVTLLGPGGVGKTRLAIAIGAAEQTSRNAGVWFADFSSDRDSAHVPQTLGRSLGLHESGGSGWSDLLVNYIGSSDRLLIFDNCEHVVDACAQLAEHLLTHCPHMKILATSRLPVGVGGEQRFEVPPLEVPSPRSSKASSDASDFRSYSALRLFEARARLVSPTFELTQSNLSRVASICAEVDGLPLGIEMAAARLGALSLDEIARRLDDKLLFLRNPARTTAQRHKSLGAVIEWSYDLLPLEAQTLFQRLSAFGGGWTLAAAEAICGFGQFEAGMILEALVGLTEASLVERHDGRYRFLETIHQFATDRLQEGVEREEVRVRHLEWFLAFAQESEAMLRGREQARWFQLLDAELENLRIALECSLTKPDASAGLRLCGALWRFWQSRGILSEGRKWCARVLELSVVVGPTVDRANTLNGAGALARDQSDYAAALSSDSEALAIHRDLGNQEGIATSLIGLGIVAMHTGEYDAAWARCSECLAIRRAIGDRWGVASALNNLGIVAMYMGDHATALSYHEEGMKISLDAGDRYALARSLTNMGRVELINGDLASARTHHEESTIIRRELGDRSGIARSLCYLGRVAMYQGDDATAIASHEESLSIGREIGDRRCITENIEALGSLEYNRGRAPLAALLWACAEVHREAIGSPLPPDEMARHTAEIDHARRIVGEKAFVAGWKQGKGLTVEDAAALALSDRKPGVDSV